MAKFLVIKLSTEKEQIVEFDEDAYEKENDCRLKEVSVVAVSVTLYLVYRILPKRDPQFRRVN